VTVPRRHAVVVLACVLVFVVCCPAPGGARNTSGKKPAVAAVVGDARLWEKALALQEQGNRLAAAESFLELQEKFPGSPRGEEALWRGANLLKEEAMAADLPDWDAVRNAFKRFVSDYPRSEHVPAAYLDVGLAHFRMRFFREALIYFNLFLKRYPESATVPEALVWKAQTLLDIGRPSEAADVVRDFPGAADPALRLQAAAILAAVLLDQGKFQEVVALCDREKEALVTHPERLVDFLTLRGRSYLRLGEEEAGRNDLWRYVNMVEKEEVRRPALFEIAESLHRQGQAPAAKYLYQRIVDQGQPEEREVVMAGLRLARYADDPDQAGLVMNPPPMLTTLEGDAPYARVLDKFAKEPMAQDARYGLFKRYLARDDFEAALQVGKSFLQYAEVGHGVAPAPRGGEVFLKLVDELQKRGEHRKIYDLYVAEYRLVDGAGQGHLLYLVGQSLETLGLYDLAAQVYDRAQALPLAEAEKADLDFRRARVYLAMKDFSAAERLLKDLREHYPGKPQLADAMFLSGRLKEAEGTPAEALNFYEQAVAGPAAPAANQEEYAQAHLRLLLAQGQEERAAEALEQYRRTGWLADAALQGWYGRLGLQWRQRQQYESAAAAFRAAVAEGMPQEGETVQSIHLFLGDVLLKLGDREAGRRQLEAAGAGPDKTKQEFARRLLQEEAIDQTLAAMPSLFKE